MAKYVYGINGLVSGKVGSVVGARWRNRFYLRSLPRKSSKPRTGEQIANQNAFGYISRWLRPITTLINVGYESYNEDCTARNSAQSYNLKNALIKTSDGYEIDYQRARFSDGPLQGTSSVQVQMLDAETLEISWNAETPRLEILTDQQPGKGSDSLLYFVYFPEMNEAIIDIGSYKRKEGRAEVTIPSQWRSSRMEVQIAFKSTETNEVSRSQYAGGISSKALAAEHEPSK